MGDLQDILSKFDPAARDIFKQRFMPLADGLQKKIQENAPQAEAQAQLEELKQAYIDVVTAQAAADMKTRNVECLRTLIDGLVLETPGTVFNGFKRAIEVAYEGKPTSRATAVKLIEIEMTYLIWEKISLTTDSL